MQQDTSTKEPVRNRYHMCHHAVAVVDLLAQFVPVFTKCRIGIFIKIEILAPKYYKCERLQSLNIIKLINNKNQNGGKACTDVSTETSNCQFDEVTYPWYVTSWNYRQS